MRRSSFILAALAAALLAGCAVAPAPPPTRTAPPVGYGPLPETGRLLAVRLAEAEASVDQETASNPSRLASLRMTRAAVGLIEDGYAERALDLLERALTIDGSTGFPYLYIGYVHLQAGRADHARAFIERGAALMPLYAPLENELQGLRLAAHVEAVDARHAP